MHSTAETTAPHPAGADDSGVQTVAFVSLGCPKNLVDSEKMLGLLAEDGVLPVPADAAELGEADAVVINTCGFLEASKEESVDEIRRAAELKKQGLIKRVIVAGCLVQRHRAKMLEWCPDIDALIGVFDRDRIVEAVRGPVGRRQKDVGIELPVYSSIAANATIAQQHRNLTGGKQAGYYEDDSARLRLTPRHYAYLRISEGCNQNCAFCTIPSIRGKMRSKPVDRILGELRELMADGAYEINLIGQDTTSYGHDIGYDGPGQGLVGLIRELDQVAGENGGAWLRLMYAYPSCFSDEMIEAIASAKHLLPYIDMPLQHISDPVLDGMRRKTSRELIETLLYKLRDRIGSKNRPMTIRTTMISGFPGETDQQHQELVDFIREFGFDNLGVFPYSPEPGTPAGRMHAQGLAVPQEVIDERIEELMLVQQEIAFSRNAELSERQAEFDVLIDAETDSELEETSGVTQGGKLYLGRTYQQAPDIDGVTYVQSKRPLAPGELLRCAVVAYSDYDLVVRPLDELHGRVSLPVMR